MDFNIPSDLKVAVLMGARGSERQISLQSGSAIADALRRTAAVEVIEQDYNPDNPQILDDKTINVFFLAFHGEFGEGGKMQALCEQKGLIFTGCDSRASALCFDKAECKKVLSAAGIVVADSVLIDSAKKIDVIDSLSAEKFAVKPTREGSSVGVSIVGSSEEAKLAAEKCFSRFGTTMVEEFIAGREIAVGVVDGKSLPVIEIKTGHDFYDYNAKYDDDSTEYLFDTITDKELLRKINETAIKSFNAAGCKDFSRVDMIVTDTDVPYVIEINTIPGFTSHSLLPKAAAKMGMDMGRLCLKIVELAILRKNIG